MQETYLCPGGREVLLTFHRNILAAEATTREGEPCRRPATIRLQLELLEAGEKDNAPVRHVQPSAPVLCSARW